MLFGDYCNKGWFGSMWGIKIFGVFLEIDKDVLYCVFCVGCCWIYMFGKRLYKFVKCVEIFLNCGMIFGCNVD